MRPAASLVACALLVACGDDPRPPAAPEGPPPHAMAPFLRYTVDAAARGAAYVSVGDLDGDRRPDLVVSKFGVVEVASDGKLMLPASEVSVYYQGQSLNHWRKVDLLTADAGLRFANETTLADLDGDGDLDVIIPAGFFVCTFDPAVGPCGALVWLENRGQAGFLRHDVVAPGSARFFHRAVAVDFDGDRRLDLVSVGETAMGGQAVWWKGDDSADRFARTPLEIGEGGGGLPTVLDLDGDGDLDVASAEFFSMGSSFTWFERTAQPTPDRPAGAFTRHVIASDAGRGMMLAFVPDLFGDGRLRALGTNHTNTSGGRAEPDSAVFAMEIPADPRSEWPRRTISEGIVSRPNDGFKVRHAPGVIGWGDVDGDRDLDVLVSGDGDPRTFWLEQTAPGQFQTRVVEASLGQAGGARAVDLDGDGRVELVFTGYEDNVVYVYRWQGQG